MMQVHMIRTWTQPHKLETVHTLGKQPSCQEPSTEPRTSIIAPVTPVANQTSEKRRYHQNPTLETLRRYHTSDAQVYVGREYRHGHWPPDNTTRTFTTPPWPQSAATVSVELELAIRTTGQHHWNCRRAPPPQRHTVGSLLPAGTQATGQTAIGHRYR